MGRAQCLRAGALRRSEYIIVLIVVYVMCIYIYIHTHIYIDGSPLPARLCSRRSELHKVRAHDDRAYVFL